ncbi:MAG: DUF1993 domain-containing protein [Myxococcota bacterium]
MIHVTIGQMTQMLKNLKGFLAQGEALATAKKFDSTNLLHARLVPDMFPLTRQVQAACDTAKFTASRLSGKEAPKHEDNEQTLEELQARIDATVAYLEGFTAEDFEGGLERRITLPFRPGYYAIGQDYLLQFGVPNFYFHVTTAYNILRHNGAELGKIQYLGVVNLIPLDEG